MYVHHRALRRELVNEETGEIHGFLEEQKRRRSYALGGQYGQISFERVLDMLAYESGLTGDDIRAFFYCGIMTYRDGGATAKKTAEHLGITPQACRRILKKLSEHKMLLVADVVGRTIKYRASPHIISALSGEEQAIEAAAYHLPTLPGRPDTAKDKADVTKPVPRARRVAGAHQRSASPEAEPADDVRPPRRARRTSGDDGGPVG
ncbi:winged helix-turn-helix domain-containing protein [Streptomyces sp. NPDC055815]